MIIAARYTPDEVSAIEKKAGELGLDKSDFVRKGSLLLVGKNVNILPESVEKYYFRLFKKKIVEFVGPEDGHLSQKVQEFVGKEPKKRNT